MRCKYGGTPKCKVNKWPKELKLLRQLVLATGLTEEIKWSMPVYTHQGKNIVSVNALKDSANLVFFKGALLTDQYQLLKQQGTIQSGRIIRFNNFEDINKIKLILHAYILEAIAIEESGEKIIRQVNPEPVPQELLDLFKQDPDLKQAFDKLTKGKQRGYIIHFSQPKQSTTRIARIQKQKESILNGIGFNQK